MVGQVTVQLSRELLARAARELGILSQGVAVVEVSLYRKPTDIPYEPEPEDIPEINLETTKGESIIPQWQDSVVTNDNKRRP